jgi:hypothetical protein
MKKSLKCRSWPIEATKKGIQKITKIIEQMKPWQRSQMIEFGQIFLKGLNNEMLIVYFSSSSFISQNYTQYHIINHMHLVD